MTDGWRIVDGDAVDDELSQAALAELRAAIYRLLSQSFLHPSEERVAQLVAAAAEIAKSADTLCQFAFFGRCQPLLRELMVLDQGDPLVVQRRYVALFAVNAAGVPCPPYESVYREVGGRPGAWLTSLVEQEYAAAGLSPSQGLGNPPDHVAVEMEFMAVLCDREREACQRGHLGESVKAQQIQESFLQRHLAVWLPELSRSLGAADAGGLYAALGDAASAFVGHDRDLVAALLECRRGPGDTDSGGPK